MSKVNYDNIVFDSELEVEYYKYLKDNNIRFIYQNEYKNKPIKINLGRRKTYTPDFIVFDDENKIIKIIELKGYAKWSANEDNNIMDFMRNKVATDKDFLIDWLAKLDIDTRGWDIEYHRLKHLKSFGFVEYDFKNPNTISNQRKNKIIELEKEIKELKEYKKNVERYFSYLRKTKLNKSQKEWLLKFEKDNGLYFEVLEFENDDFLKW